MKWLCRLVNRDGLRMLGQDHKDSNGKYDVVFNEEFDGDTPREARKAARVKYPLRSGWRLGFTKKVR